MCWTAEGTVWKMLRMLREREYHECAYCGEGASYEMAKIGEVSYICSECVQKMLDDMEEDRAHYTALSEAKETLAGLFDRGIIDADTYSQGADALRLAMARLDERVIQLKDPNF